MAAYLVVELDITDRVQFDRYRGTVLPILEAHGGRFLVRGGAVQAMEGTAPPVVAIAEFPDLAAARRFYDSPARCSD